MGAAPATAACTQTELGSATLLRTGFQPTTCRKADAGYWRHLTRVELLTGTTKAKAGGVSVRLGSPNLT